MMIWKKYKNKANKKINYKLKNKRVTENLINILKEENWLEEKEVNYYMQETN